MNRLEVTTETRLEPTHLCRDCGTASKPGEQFCGQCGSELELKEHVSAGDGFEEVVPTLGYYFATLLLLGIYKLTEAFPGGVEGQTSVALVYASLVIGFSLHFRHHLLPLLSLRSINGRILLATIIGGIAGALVVDKVAGFINLSLYDDVYYSPYLFQDTSFPLLWATGMTCVYPAIFEEIAFRGFIFSNVAKFSTARGAVFISAIVFGVIHLSFISLLWLIPLGVVFGLLRLKYHSLWYGIIGHFTYNFVITLLEFYSL